MVPQTPQPEQAPQTPEAAAYVAAKQNYTQAVDELIAAALPLVGGWKDMGLLRLELERDLRRRLPLAPVIPLRPNGGEAS